MFYVLTTTKDVVLALSETLEYLDKDNIIIENGTHIIYRKIIANIYEVNKEFINQEYNSCKYCYTPDKGFYLNPEYNPKYTLIDRISALEDAVNAILEL